MNRPQRPRAELHGLIVLDKPRGISSARALDRVRRITRVRKSGHAGTLDPQAEGVLLICLGRATRRVEKLMDLPKTYRTTARLDWTSPGYDAEGDVEQLTIEQVPDEARVREALRGFEGWIEQVPPALSAIKVGGRPAYALARSGKAPKLEPRRVRIDRIELLRYQWPEIEFELVCGRGTYVRAVIRDLGERLGTGGCLTRLARTAIGPFRRELAWSFERLAVAEPEDCLIPLETLDRILAGHTTHPDKA